MTECDNNYGGNSQAGVNKFAQGRGNIEDSAEEEILELVPKDKQNFIR